MYSMFYVLDSYDPACVDDDYSTVMCSSLNIMSPGFGSKKLYENNMFCDWKVIAETDHVLQLTIHTLEIEDSKFCSKDFLWLVCKPYNAGCEITVGKQTPCKLSFVYTSQVKMTVRTEPKFG